MNENVSLMMFALLGSAVSGNPLISNQKALFCEELLPDLFKMSSRHDVAHLVGTALTANGLSIDGNPYCEKFSMTVIRAVYRFEQLNYEYIRLCDTLEEAKIPFIPLKGSVLRRYYPEPWMRTSCDVDILVHKEDLEAAVAYLVEHLNYSEAERSTHDIVLSTPSKKHIELHFDLVEEGRANFANDVLNSVWGNVSLCEDKKYWYEMTDEFFYFYHIAHMAKHFEVGGCGVRPFIDLWILDNISGFDKRKRKALIEKGGLTKFSDAARRLYKIWFCGKSSDELSVKMQNYILTGGVYGSIANKVAVQQTKKGGRVKYIFSRIFVPYSKLKRYYPVLEKHRWLTPVMQVRRWGMLFKPDVARMAKSELSENKTIEKDKVDSMSQFLDELGL